MISKSLLVSALPAVALATVHDVTVGEGGLKFIPDNINAAVGDTVNFHFYPGDHSVAQSTFSAPCVPSGSDAVYSGFINPTSGVDSQMFQMVVENTDPMWLYCSSSEQHCQSGMSMVINAPSGMTIGDYQTAAASAQTVTSPMKVSGGKVVPNMNGEAAGGSAGSSSSASASMTMSETMSGSMASSSSTAMSSGMSSSMSMASSAASVASATAASSGAMSSAMSSAASTTSAAAASSISTGSAASFVDARAPGALLAAVAALFSWALM